VLLRSNQKHKGALPRTANNFIASVFAAHLVLLYNTGSQVVLPERADIGAKAVYTTNGGRYGLWVVWF